MANSVANTSVAQPAIDQELIARMTRNYPMQTGWLLAKCDHILEQVDSILSGLQATKRNEVTRMQLTQLRAYIAANNTLFDIIAAKEKVL